MHKVKNNQTPNIFNNIFSKLENKYNTRLCEHNFTKPLYKTKPANTPLPFEYHNYGTVLYQQIIKNTHFSFLNPKLKLIVLI